MAAQCAPGSGGKTLALHPDGEGKQTLVLQALPLDSLAVVGDPALDDEGTQLAGVRRIEQAQVQLDGAGPIRSLEPVRLEYPVAHDGRGERRPASEPHLGQGLEGEPVQGHRRTLQSPLGKGERL